MDEGQWVPESEVGAFLANHADWSIGVLDKARNVVWVAPPGGAPPPPDLNQPWPGRPANEVPRAKYRSDGTAESAGYLPGGKGEVPDSSRWADVELPWVLVPMKWIKTVAELEAHIAPIRTALGG